MKTQPSEETIGEFFLDRRTGEVYRHISYSKNPTATLEALDNDTTPNKLQGVVGALIFDDLVLLVPEVED